MPKRAKRGEPNGRELELLTVLLQGGTLGFNAGTDDDTPHDENTGEVRANGHKCRILEHLVSVGRQIYARSVLERLKTLGLVNSDNEPTDEARTRFHDHAKVARSFKKYVHEDRAAA